MVKQKRLNNVFSTWLTGGGIFEALASLEGVTLPWSEDVEPGPLSLEYHGNISGDKYISPLLVKMLNDADLLTASQLENLAQIIYSLYGPYWAKEYATLKAEYNPINNYDMTEHEEGQSSTEATSESGIYGFNSSEASPNNSGAGNNSGEYSRDLTRSGNIGVTTSQQMLESERNLWLWNFFYEVVFPNIDKVLTIALY